MFQGPACYHKFQVYIQNLSCTATFRHRLKEYLLKKQGFLFIWMILNDLFCVFDALYVVILAIAMYYLKRLYLHKDFNYSFIYFLKHYPYLFAAERAKLAKILLVLLSDSLSLIFVIIYRHNNINYLLGPSCYSKGTLYSGVEQKLFHDSFGLDLRSFSLYSLNVRMINSIQYIQCRTSLFIVPSIYNVVLYMESIYSLFASLYPPQSSIYYCMHACPCGGVHIVASGIVFERNIVSYSIQYEHRAKEDRLQ